MFAPVRIDDDRLIGINWIKVNASVARGTCEYWRGYVPAN